METHRFAHRAIVQWGVELVCLPMPGFQMLVRLQGEQPTGYEPFEGQQVTNPSKDNRLQALRETTGHEPFERQQVTSPRETTAYEPFDMDASKTTGYESFELDASGTAGYEPFGMRT